MRVIILSIFVVGILAMPSWAYYAPPETDECSHSKIAGTGVPGYSGDGGMGPLAQLKYPQGVATSLDSNNLEHLYIADSGNHVIRKFGKMGVITTFAGIGKPGFDGDGGPANKASLNWPTDVAVDAEGNVYIADSGNHRIRVVDSDGIITTIAGNGKYPMFEKFLDGPALETPIGGIEAIDIDSNGVVYFASGTTNMVRKVEGGQIVTIAGTGQSGFSGDGGPSTEAKLTFPRGIVVDHLGNIYISDTGNFRIRKIDPSGIINTVAGNGSNVFSGDGGPATEAAIQPRGIDVDAAGDLFIADVSMSWVVRKVTCDGKIKSLFVMPKGWLMDIAVGDHGYIYYSMAASGAYAAVDRQFCVSSIKGREINCSDELELGGEQADDSGASDTADESPLDCQFEKLYQTFDPRTNYYDESYKVMDTTGDGRCDGIDTDGDGWPDKNFDYETGYFGGPYTGDQQQNPETGEVPTGTPLSATSGSCSLIRRHTH